MRKIKVLISDDNKIIAESIKRIIDKIEGVEVVGMASNGEEEYNFIKIFHPDFLFSDVQMLKMTGIEVLEKLNNENFEKIPRTVFVTGENINILNNTTITNNIYDIISKPFNIDRILSIMENYIYEVNQYEKIHI